MSKSKRSSEAEDEFDNLLKGVLDDKVRALYFRNKSTDRPTDQTQEPILGSSRLLSLVKKYLGEEGIRAYQEEVIF